MIHFWPLLVLALHAGSAAAGTTKFLGFRPSCAALEEVQQRAKSCTDNIQVVESARDCYRQLMRAWQEAPKDLRPKLSSASMGKNAKQEEAYARAQSDYRESMRKLRDLINLTDQNADLIASYPLVMREDPDEAVDCYTNAFNQVQEIVDRLEDKLDEGLRAEGAAEGLRGISGDRDQKVDSSSQGGLIGKESRVPRPVASPLPSGRQANRDSNVSGKTDEEKFGERAGAPNGNSLHKAMKNESDSAWVNTFLENIK